MLSSIQSYSIFIYSLQERYPVIQRSTLVLKPMGTTIGELVGQLEFLDGFILKVVERIDFAAGRIEDYSYWLYHRGEKVEWYDPQPHPHLSVLASTHPHHKHIRPNIKHNCVPAPGISFSKPNLPFLINKVTRLIEQARSQPHDTTYSSPH